MRIVNMTPTFFKIKDFPQQYVYSVRMSLKKITTESIIIYYTMENRWEMWEVSEEELESPSFPKKLNHLRVNNKIVKNIPNQECLEYQQDILRCSSSERADEFVQIKLFDKISFTKQMIYSKIGFQHTSLFRKHEIVRKTKEKANNIQSVRQFNNPNHDFILTILDIFLKEIELERIANEKKKSFQIFPFI